MSARSLLQGVHVLTTGQIYILTGRILRAFKKAYRYNPYISLYHAAIFPPISSPLNNSFKIPTIKPRNRQHIRSTLTQSPRPNNTLIRLIVSLAPHLNLRERSNTYTPFPKIKRQSVGLLFALLATPPHFGDRRHICAHRGASICSAGCSRDSVAAVFNHEKRNRLAPMGREAGLIGLLVESDGLADGMAAVADAERRKNRNNKLGSMMKYMV
jgi:hypothetical protein